MECTVYIFGGPTPSCKPCFGLSANHVNIMQSPPSLSLHGVHTHTHCPMPLQESSMHSWALESAHSWAVEEKAWGCRQEPAVHIERLCGLMHSKSLCTEISPAFHSRLVHIFSLCYSILLWVWSRPPVQVVLTILAFGILLVVSCLFTNSLYRSVLSLYWMD